MDTLTHPCPAPSATASVPMGLDELRDALDMALIGLFDSAAQLHTDTAPGTAPDVLVAYQQGVADLQRLAAQQRLNGLSYVSLLMDSALLRLMGQQRPLRDAECEGLAQWPASVMAELMAPDPLGDAMDGPAAWSVLHQLGHFGWFPTVSAHDVQIYETRLEQDRQRLSQPSQQCQSSPISEPPAAGLPELARPQDTALEEPGNATVTPQELAMLTEALATLHADLCALLDAPAAPDGLQTAFDVHIEQLHNIVNAANMVGLLGLQKLLERILINTVALQTEPLPMADDLQALLRQWPLLTMAYLQSPEQRIAAQVLVHCVAQPQWPLACSEEDLADCLAEMAAVTVRSLRANTERAATALPEHMDISAPADIDPKVLESLLIELPPHAQDFSVLVQRLFFGGNADDLEQARRVAHTLKGAANTVGIKGVANLTHALEDILAAYVRDERVPGAQTAETETLLEAADCLESMSEALLQGGAAPVESLSVYQRVLDLANLLDGKTAADDPMEDDAAPMPLPMPVSPTSAGVPRPSTLAFADAEAEAGAEETAETYLRVPASLIDALLKLSGEGSIVTSQIQDRVKRLGDNIHALRSGSRLFGQLSGELEQLVDVQGLTMLGGNTGDLDALEMDQYNELHMVSRRIMESGADNREFSRSFEREISSLRDLIAEKERVQLAMQRSIQRTRMVDVSSVAPRLQRAVRQAARMLGRTVDLRIVGEQTMVDTQLLDRIIDPLMHLLRNAVDHGIEAADVRAAAGKPAGGTITLRFSSQGNHVNVRCEDDGAGLDLAAIRARALSAGLIAPDAVLSDAQVMRLIVLPGFSTRTQTTQLSGRGIGMDVVQRAVLDLRGTLELESNPGQGTSFVLGFPVSMSTLQVMLTQSEQHLLALSVRGVDQILPAREELVVADDGSLHYQLQGKPVAAIRLETLLGLPRGGLQPEGAMEVAMLIRTADRELVAIIVPELHDARMVVVKPFNTIMPRILGVDGSTILGDGAVASVLDLPDLQRAYQMGDTGDSLPGVAVRAAKLPLCLVVDDSVSVRRTVELLMQDSGYEVMTARDGVDALGQVRARAPDIVLVDLEMPRMNGLDLTSALRTHAATQSTPVVMITSRFTEKHRKLATDAGVNAFLTKPYSEDLLLNTMDQLLRQAA